MDFILFVTVILLLLSLPASQGKELYMGCFSAEKGNSLTGFVFRTSSLTPSVCIKECKSRGFLYAALQGGHNCYCGTEPMEGKSSDDSECSIKCSGDSSDTCGGKNTAKLYIVKEGLKEVPFLLEGNIRYLGCFAERERSNRKLKEYWSQKVDMSTDECTTTCRLKGYLYAGLVEGNTCYCGSGQAILSERADPSKCNMTCWLEGWKCGGKLHASVYGLRECENAEPNKYVFYVGCYKEMPQEVLKRVYTINYNRTICNTVCIKECRKVGFLYAALHSRPGIATCHCHNYYRSESERLPDSVCNTPCVNSTLDQCTKDTTNRVFSVGKCYPTAYSDFFEYYEGKIKFLGCYKGSTLSPQLTGYNVIKKSMAVKLCIRMCRDLGFMYAAVHAGKMCSCGNEHSPSNLKAKENECKSHCNLEFFRGGGYKRYNLYYVNDCVQGKFIMQPNHGIHLGCFQDYIGRTLEHEFKDNSLTITRCYDHCKANGYFYYALQGLKGNFCFCGNGPQRLEDRLDNKFCSVPCIGNRNELCGHSEISSVYAIGVCQNTNFTPPLTFEKYRDKPYKPRFEGKKPWIDKYNNFSSDFE